MTVPPHPRPTDPTRWLAEALATGAISRVAPNPRRAGDLITQARAHITSARSVAETDPTLALAACHTALRKSIDAHLGAAGLRVENRPGAHRRAIEYAETQLSAVLTATDIHEADRLRLRRHEAEYGERPSAQFGPDEVRHYADLADRFVNTIARRLAAS